MAQFYGTLESTPGKPCTRTGTKKTGLHAEVNAWDRGIRVEAYTDHDGNDRFLVYITGGSNDRRAERLALEI